MLSETRLGMLCGCNAKGRIAKAACLIAAYAMYKLVIQPILRNMDKIAAGVAGGAMGWGLGCTVNFDGQVLACYVENGAIDPILR